MDNYKTLNELQVYSLARNFSKIAWEIYSRLDWRTKKIIGDQFIFSIDSIGANIAEGYGRYHYLDKIKFYYNSRGSYYESIFHWLEILMERNMIENSDYYRMIEISREFAPKLNSFISVTYKKRDNTK